MGHAKAYKNPDGDSLRADALSKLGHPRALLLMDRGPLLRLQTALGFGSEWGTFRIPSHWQPPGEARKPNALFLSLHKALPPDWPLDDKRAEQALVSLAQIALMRYLTPAGRRRFFPTTNTWRAYVNQTIRVAGAALSRRDGTSRQLWSLLTEEDVFGILHGRSGRLWINHLRLLHSRGLVTDCIPERPELDTGEEPVRKGRTAPSNDVNASATWQPLQDNFVAEAGWRVTWIIRELGPHLLGLAEALARVETSNAGWTPNANKNFARARQKSILDKWQWKTPEGRSITEIPFKLNMKTSIGRNGPGNRMRDLEWPKLSPTDVDSLLTLLQAAHAFVLFLSNGPRSSEQMSLTVDCLVEGTNGDRIGGRTYKLAFRNDGQQRDWPCPELAAVAIKQQIRLASLLKRHGVRGSHLWVLTKGGSRRGEELSGFNGILSRLVDVLDIRDLLDGLQIHTHRFRKTVARLIALAIVGAPKIIMDLFGHTDIEMTISYILSDRDIRAQAEMVAKAQIVILAKDAATSSERNGGLAAGAVRDVVERTKARLSKDALDSDDLEEVAVALTLGGRSWQLVRPGVICTKTELESGPCTRRVGHPETSRCRTNCINRLELGSERSNVDAVLQQAVNSLARATDNEDPIQAELWTGQILTHLDRFPDLRQKWSNHPVVAKVLLLGAHKITSND